MLKIVVGSDISLIKYKLFGGGYIQNLMFKSELGVDNIFIQNLNDLWHNLSESLFSSFEDNNERFLVRFEKDSSIADSEKILLALQKSRKDFYVVFDSLLAKDKQVLKKWFTDLEILEYKKIEEGEKQEILDLFLNYCQGAPGGDSQGQSSQLKPLRLKKPQIKKVLEVYQSPNDIIDFLDILQIIQNSTLDFDKVFEIFFTSEIELFKMGFASQNQVLSWYKRLNIDDLQMILSLIFGKIERSSLDIEQKKAIQKIIIRTDWKLKSQKNHISLAKYSLIQAMRVL